MGRIAAIAILGTLCAGCSSAPEPAAAPAPVARTTTAPSPAPSSTPPATGFPSAEALGPRWQHRGKEHPRKRDPQEVTALAVPLGCPRNAALPEAGRAFELDYTFEGAPVVAIRLDFTSERRARRFLAARDHNVRSCVGRADSPAIGPYVGQVRGPLNDRTPDSEPWTELVLRRGSDVFLMAAAVALGEPPFTSAGVARIRGALG